MAQRSAHVQVVPSIDGWAVRREGDDTALSRHPTEEEAVEAGRILAREEGVDLVRYDTSGGVREHESHREGPTGAGG